MCGWLRILAPSAVARRAGQASDKDVEHKKTVRQILSCSTSSFLHKMGK
jgi:hypothetical protein